MSCENEVVGEGTSVKLPKNCKENRYYYRHREEILEKKRQKRLEDPEYKAKKEAREEAKRKREEEKKEENRKKALERSRERAKRKAELLGVLPASPPGAE